MSRWIKNIVVPLDSTKESANRPTVSRSLGTVGKWGKMGFTSTRTYTMSALPAAVATAAAAVAAAANNSPQESPASHKDLDDLSVSTPEPPKPRKFFKSRNTTPPEVIAQIIQQLPRQATSPIRDISTSSYITTTPSILNTPIAEPLKVKIPKSNFAERKKKSSKTTKLKNKNFLNENNDSVNKKVKGKLLKSDVDNADNVVCPVADQKSIKKKKSEKELKPEAPPSRILSRARKTVNYCEDNDEDRLPTPIKDIVIPKQKKPDKVVNVQETPPPTPVHKLDDAYAPCDTPEPVLPPPAAVMSTTGIPSNNTASRTPEHPPIVLRISKGTSRLVSTDSEGQPNASLTPPSQHSEIASVDAGIEGATKSRQSSIDDNCNNNTPITNATFIAKHINKSTSSSPETTLMPPSSLPSTIQVADEPPEINYCTVKISPDKPPKERLKLIIKTDFIRNALAAAKAAKAAAAAAPSASSADKSEALSSLSNEHSNNYNSAGRPEKDRPKKNKKHKHSKHLIASVGVTTPLTSDTAEFKTPSPHLALGSGNSAHDPVSFTQTQVLPQTQSHQLQNFTGSTARTVSVISPAALSEKDFDSQSSVLGSISSKGNSTPQALPAVPDESCVMHSRGSSVITSDLETSQHSSLVAPPSDIELRLESMMMDGDASQQHRTNTVNNYVEAEPLQEDILAVLRGDESAMNDDPTSNPSAPSEKCLENGSNQMTMTAREINNVETSKDMTEMGRRVTRGKTKASYAENDMCDAFLQELATRKRNRKTLTTTPVPAADEVTGQKRVTRRGKKLETAITSSPVPTTTASASPASVPMDVNTVVESSTKQVTTRIDQNVLTNNNNLINNNAITTIAKNNEINANSNSTTVRRGRSRMICNQNQNQLQSNGNCNNNNNITNNNNNNINKIAANLSAKAGAAELQKTSTNSEANVPPNTTQQRSYSRKRKNQQVTQVLQPSAEELEDIQNYIPNAKQPNLDLPSNANASIEIATNLLQTIHENCRTPNLDTHETNSMDSNSLPRPTSSIEAPLSPPPSDYKIKDKFKRTLTLDNQVNNAIVTKQLTTANDAGTQEKNQTETQRTLAMPVSTCTINNNNAVVNSTNNSMKTNTMTTAVATVTTTTEPSVKLVISKKKGSIFKSRVPSSIQTEQQANSKRHLYKHRWDASINGDANSCGSNSNSNSGGNIITSSHTIKQLSLLDNNKTNINSAVDGFYNDFNSDEARSSPLLTSSKMTRVIKQNPQAMSSHALSASGNAINNYSNNASGGGNNTSGNASSNSTSSDKNTDFYTVVRNVKTAHQIQEIGEYQEMDDDVEYILDALQPHNPMSTRCLSALQLATKCMIPAFRMHVRAHGIVSKFFKVLADANRDLSLGLCTTAIMYILSQEGLNMDLDRDSLELMMNLLESEQIAPAQADHANYEKNKQKVRELCEELKAQGKGTHLNVESITVGTLAMETLLSLTSKRAGEWFKDELRELGGLEHIIKTINDCCKPVIDNVHNVTGINWTRPLLDNMQTVERCMRVLENVTQMNEENQHYILTYAEPCRAVTTLCSLYSLCDRELILYPTRELTISRDNNPGIVMRDLLIPLMKVLINLTHSFSSIKAEGANLIGQHEEVIITSFHLLLKAPNYIPDRYVFEMSILALLLLINLAMYTATNRAKIMQAYAPTDVYGIDNSSTGIDISIGSVDGTSTKKETAISAIMSYFYKCEELAGLVEKNTDAFLDNQEKNKKKQEEVDATVNNLLQKAGHHMEHSLKGSYTAILIGLLITDNEQYEEVVRQHSHGNSFREIINVLEKYYNFMSLTASSEASAVAHVKSTKKLLDYFKKRDLIYEMNKETKKTTETTTTFPSNLDKFHKNALVVDNNKSVHNINNNSGGAIPTTTTLTAGSQQTQRVYKTYGQSQR